MAGGIAQLHYSWSRRGVEGANRFQIVRMSASLDAGRLRPLLPTVRRICRYDRPAGRAGALPTSFGWFDHEHHRVAFRRVALPPRAGSVANFAAHVLVGPPAQMRESALASLFGSPFWWSGDDPELPVRALPGVELPELAELPIDGPAPNARRPAPSSVALCHALLTLPRDERLKVAVDADEFGLSLREVATLLPDAVAGLSLSTYEGSHAIPFRVTGTFSRSTTGRVCALDRLDGLDARERDTIQRLLDAGEQAGALREAIAQLGRRDRLVVQDADARRHALWDDARALVALADGEEADERMVETALATSAGLAYLAEQEPGMERIVSAVRRGSAIALASLRAAAPRLGGVARDALYARIMTSYVPPADLRGCAAAAESLPAETARKLFEQVLRSVLVDAAAARTLGASDVVGVLAHAAATNRSPDELAGVLDAVSRHAGVCAARDEIPAAYVVGMLRALLADSATPDDLVDVLCARPRVLDRVALSEREKDRCLELLERVDPRRLAARLSALAVELADADRMPRLLSVLERAPVQTAASLALAAARSHAGGALSSLCDRTATRVVEQELAQPSAGNGGLALELLEHSRSASASSARRALTMIDAGWETKAVARQAAAIEDGELRAAIVGLASVHALAHARDYGAVREGWRYVRRTGALAESEAEALRRLLTTALDRCDGSARIWVLAWMAVELLPEHRRMVGRAGRLNDSDADRLARALADSVPEATWDGLAGAVRVADRQARRWWDGVRAHPSRRAKREQRR